MLGISQVAAQLAASQEALSFMNECLNLVDRYESFRRMGSVSLQYSSLKMQAAISSKPFVAIYQNVRCHIPEE
jgi:hypothetical protein